jgi:hypothetical protein
MPEAPGDSSLGARRTEPFVMAEPARVHVCLRRVGSEHAASGGRRAEVGGMRPSMRALVLWLGLSLACGASTPPPVEAPPPADTYALVDLVPGDAREVLVLRPPELLASETTRPLVDAIAPPEWRRSLGDRTGVYAEDVSELLLARWEDGAWWALVRVPRATDVVRAATARMAPVEVESEAPFVRRIGYLAEERYELVALAPELLLVARGRPEGVIALLRALRRPRATSEPRPLLRSEGAAWLALPQPLGLPLDTPVGLLLAEQTGLRVEARPSTRSNESSASPSSPSPASPSAPPASSPSPSSAPAEDRVRITLWLEGELPDGAAENFRALLGSLSATDLGRVLGLPEALPTLAIAHGPNGIELAADFDPATLARGVRLLFRAEISEIVEETESPPAL